VAVAAFDLARLLENARTRALHLEMRDWYVDLDPRGYRAWAETGQLGGHEAWAEWRTMLAPLVGRGGDLRRARIVSMPLSRYTQWEYEVAHENIAAGEHVRWLARREASDLRLPGNDFWLVDDALLFLHFSGDGLLLEVAQEQRPPVIDFCERAFESVWERGLDHDKFSLG
jgi:hypothetical protein